MAVLQVASMPQEFASLWLRVIGKSEPLPRSLGSHLLRRDLNQAVFPDARDAPAHMPSLVWGVILSLFPNRR